MAKEYVEHRDGGIFVQGTRVSLESVVCSFLRGESPEGIAQSFPALTLEQIFGALAYYIANRETVDQYLVQSHDEFEAMRQQFTRANPELYAKLADARQKTPAR